MNADRIRAGIAAHERRLIEAGERHAALTRRRRGRPHTAGARRRISEARIQAERQRAAAEGASPLRRARLALGVSQRGLADIANVGYSVVRRAEADGPVTRLSWLRLADALGVPVGAIKPDA